MELTMEPRECADVAALDPLTERALVAMIRARYEEAKMQPLGCASQHELIYTRAGPVIVAVNPLCPVRDLYTVALRRKHHHAALLRMLKERDGSAEGEGASVGEEAGDEELPPHIYEVAGRAFHRMREGACQAVVINGESGAGKTETTKLLLEYLSEVAVATAAGTSIGSSPVTSPSQGLGDVEGQGNPSAALATKLVASSSVLEAFGNAKTLRNDNSSRFGKLIKLHFAQSTGALRYASCAHYLLEKSRVVQQQPGEQAYHAFYLLCAGAPDALRQRLALGDAATAVERFTYLQPATPALAARFAQSFAETNEALRTMLHDESLGGDEGAAHAESAVESHWRTVAAVLHLGELRFEMIESSSSDPGSRLADTCEEAAANAASLLGVTVEDLVRALTTRRIMGVLSQRTPREACVSRDTLAKAVYERLFNQVVASVNSALLSEATMREPPQRELFIGLLDIFGSEIFPCNGFEQCVGLTDPD